jgi:hypothetical protein
LEVCLLLLLVFDFLPVLSVLLPCGSVVEEFCWVCDDWFVVLFVLELCPKAMVEEMAIAITRIILFIIFVFEV